MLACSLRPARLQAAPRHMGAWSTRSARCTRAPAAVVPHMHPQHKPSQDTPHRTLSLAASAPEHTKSTIPQGVYMYNRALRLVARAAAEDPGPQPAGVLAPELCTPEALEELMAEAGPGGRLVLCRLHAWRFSRPEGSHAPLKSAAVLELVGSLDGKPVPEWEGGVELAHEAEGREWHQPLVHVLWSAERGIIRALPGAAWKPGGAEAFQPYRVQLTDDDRHWIAWGASGMPEDAWLMEDTGEGEEGEDDPPQVPEELWNRVVVEDEGVPVRVMVPVEQCVYERVLHLEAPVTLRQLLQAVIEFYNHPVVEQELEAFRRFAPDIAHYHSDKEMCSSGWAEAIVDHNYFDSIWHTGPGEYTIVVD